MDYHQPITKNNQIFSTMMVLMGCVVVVVGYIYYIYFREANASAACEAGSFHFMLYILLLSE